MLEIHVFGAVIYRASRNEEGDDIPLRPLRVPSLPQVSYLESSSMVPHSLSEYDLLLKAYISFYFIKTQVMLPYFTAILALPVNVM